MKFKYIQEAISLFESYIKGANVKVVSCTEGQIAELEALLSSPYKLPAAYKEFLLYGGGGMADFFECCSISYRLAKILIEDNYRDIIGMLIGSGGEDYLDPSIFVITEHLGANMSYFKLTEGDDPPVYYWGEEYEGGLETSKMESETFSNFLLENIEAWYRITDYKRKS